MKKILTLAILILTLSCDNASGDRELTKNTTDPETLKWLKEQKGLAATEKHIKEHQELTRGLQNKIIENPPAELKQQISNFIRTKFEYKFPEQRIIIYHPKVVSRTDNRERWSEPKALTDTTFYSVEVLLWNELDTVNWQLVFDNEFELLYDFEK